MWSVLGFSGLYFGAWLLASQYSPPFEALLLSVVLSLVFVLIIIATPEGIEVAQMIRKNQFSLTGNGFAQFSALAG